MYYTSQNIAELQAYNAEVSNKIGLKTPYKWAEIITINNVHYILKHHVHISNTLATVNELPQITQ